MPKPKTNRSLKAKARRNAEPWRLHDTYSLGVGFCRIVTRSQTAFSRLKNAESDLKLFCDPLMHQLPGKPHLIEVLKGKYGSIPRTIITRSTLQHLKVTKSLCKRVDEYKDENLRTELIQELKEYKAENMTKSPSHNKPLVKKSTEDVNWFQPWKMFPGDQSTEDVDMDTEGKVDPEDVEMDDSEAIEVQKSKKEEETMDEDNLPETTEDYLRHIHETADYYTEHKVSVDEIDKGHKYPDKYD